MGLAISRSIIDATAAGCGWSPTGFGASLVQSACRAAPPCLPVPEAEAIVFVVDDDASVLPPRAHWVRLRGFKGETFASARSSSTAHAQQVLPCLCRRALAWSERPRPAARAEPSGVQSRSSFMTGHGDIPMTVRAMKAGAVEFLTKPFRPRNLLDAIRGDRARSRSARGALRRPSFVDTTRSSHRESARSWLSSSQSAQQADRRRAHDQRATRSSFIARTSCRRWRPSRSPSGPGWPPNRHRGQA